MSAYFECGDEHSGGHWQRGSQDAEEECHQDVDDQIGKDISVRSLPMPTKINKSVNVARILRIFTASIAVYEFKSCCCCCCSCLLFLLFLLLGHIPKT